eukprot:s5114_g1.t1
MTKPRHYDFAIYHLKRFVRYLNAAYNLGLYRCVHQNANHLLNHRNGGLNCGHAVGALFANVVLGPEEWQVLTVLSLLSQMMERSGEKRDHFSDDVENLREAVRSILTFCGERLRTLPELWVLLTAYRCLKDQVEETKTLPSKMQIISSLESNPISGAAGTAELGTFDQLALCPYRVALCDDLMGGVKFAQGHMALSPEMEEVLLFLQDAHAFLHILIRLEMNGLDPQWDNMDTSPLDVNS